MPTDQFARSQRCRTCPRRAVGMAPNDLSISPWCSIPLSMDQKHESPQPGPRRFASDNYSGICRRGLGNAGSGKRSAMPRTATTPGPSGPAMPCASLETDCEVFFISSGTAANALALSSLCRSVSQHFVP